VVYPVGVTDLQPFFNLKNQSNSKQPRCAAPKNTVVKKDVKSKVAAKKWL